MSSQINKNRIVVLFHIPGLVEFIRPYYIANELTICTIARMATKKFETTVGDNLITGLMRMAGIPIRPRKLGSGISKEEKKRAYKNNFTTALHQ